MPNIRDGARCITDVNDLMQRWRNYEQIGWSEGADEQFNGNVSRTQWPMESRVEDSHIIIGKFEFNKLCKHEKKKECVFKAFQKILKGQNLNYS